MTDMSTGMEEGRRQSYLAALGIPLWSTRHDLPGAVSSGGLEFVPFAADLLAEETPEAELRIESPGVGLAEPKPLSSPVRVEPVKAPLPDTRPLMDSASPSGRTEFKNTTDHPRFSCRVQLLAPGLLAVIALDDVPDLSAQEYRLLENLMQALGGDISADAGREHFRWPLSPNPAIPRDAGAAREALAAFLGRRREATRWLVLGETLAVHVRAALPQHTVLAAPPLRELLGSPAAKRELWQSLHG